MKLYRTTNGIVLETHDGFRAIPGADWDRLINDDGLSTTLNDFCRSGKISPVSTAPAPGTILAPLQSQEVWASGVTYLRSKVGRQEESKNAGGGDFYARVYEADRPELFFKTTPHRVVSPHGAVRIRRDSSWNVPEPELTLVITASGTIVGYTVGNDMSSRSIEGENPLYLPQAKTYDGCCSLGPCVLVAERSLSPDTLVRMSIGRNGAVVFEGEVAIGQMKRSPGELVRFLFRECSFPHGALLMTGTGIIPPNDFTLQVGDEVRMSIDPIGTLINTIA